MKYTKTSILSLAVAILLGIAACGGGGGNGGLAGIGGTGIVAVGQITGFGSVFVNGVEYHLRPDSRLLVNGAQVGQDALRLGMVVSIDGSVDDSGRATINRLSYSAEIRGPVVNNPSSTVSPDGRTKTLNVMGMTVQVDALSTSFDHYSFDAMNQGDFVEVSGHIAGNGDLVATRIEKLDAQSGQEAILRGRIGRNGFVDQTHFRLQNVLVDFSNATFSPGTSLDGCLLEVRGSYDIPTQTFNATRIACADDGLPESAGEAELEGIVNNLTSVGFTLNGITVDTTSAVLEPRNLALANGMTVEVEGSLSGGTLKAAKVKGRSGEIEMKAHVASVAGDNIILEITGNNSLSVTTDPALTRMEDELSDAPLSIADIRSDDFLEIEAVVTNNGSPMAQVVKRRNPASQVVLQGPVDIAPKPALSGGILTLSVLGIPYTSSSSTLFQVDDKAVSVNDFFNQIDTMLKTSTAPVIVKIKDELFGTTAGDGVAEEMELKTGP